MYHSLKRLSELSDDTVLYPGHNYAEKPFATMAEQKHHNMFLRFQNLSDFLEVMSPFSVRG
jgi:glyoxylase-like metal-dependent hydrolase (beta-lactamase superfamily II)